MSDELDRLEQLLFEATQLLRQLEELLEDPPNESTFDQAARVYDIAIRRSERRRELLPLLF